MVFTQCLPQLKEEFTNLNQDSCGGSWCGQRKVHSGEAGAGALQVGPTGLFNYLENLSPECEEASAEYMTHSILTSECFRNEACLSFQLPLNPPQGILGKKKEGCSGGDYQTRTNPQPHTGHAQNVAYSSGKGTNISGAPIACSSIFFSHSLLPEWGGHWATAPLAELSSSAFPSVPLWQRRVIGRRHVKQRGQGENMEEWEWERKLGITWMWRRAGLEGVPGLVPGRIAKRVKCGFVLTLSGSRMPSLHP